MESNFLLLNDGWLRLISAREIFYYRVTFYYTTITVAVSLR